jgi:uncharacterized membrane protein YgcG
MVLDEPQSLTSEQRKVLETILLEHADLTGERIMIAVFKNLGGADAAQRTHEIFEDWLANRGHDKSALLAVYVDDAKALVEPGYGLETLDEKTTHAFMHDDLLPELKAGHPFKALGLALLDLLRADSSPLIDSGRALQLLQQGGLQNPENTASRSGGPARWYAFVFVGVLIFAGVFNNLLAAEAHFTGEGWYRPNPWKLLSPKQLRPLRRATKSAPLPLGGIDGSW